MIVPILALTIGAAFPPMADNSVDLHLGGLLSGPSRVYVDLDSGIRLNGELPADAPRRGDGAGIATSDLPITRITTLPPSELTRLRELSAAILKAGPESHELCNPTVDRILHLNLSFGGHKFSGTVYCPSAEAEQFFNAVWGAAN